MEYVINEVIFWVLVVGVVSATIWDEWPEYKKWIQERHKKRSLTTLHRRHSHIPASPPKNDPLIEAVTADLEEAVYRGLKAMVASHPNLRLTPKWTCCQATQYGNSTAKFCRKCGKAIKNPYIGKPERLQS